MKSIAHILSWVLILGGSFVTAQDSTTTWLGTLDAQGTKLRLEIDVIQREGKTQGQLRSLDQGNAKLDIQDIKMDESLLEFKIPALGIAYKGKIIANGSKATGTFQQGGLSFPLELSRGETVKDSDNDADSEKATFTLKEAWVGNLEIGIM